MHSTAGVVPNARCARTAWHLLTFLSLFCCVPPSPLPCMVLLQLIDRAIGWCFLPRDVTCRHVEWRCEAYMIGSQSERERGDGIYINPLSIVHSVIYVPRRDRATIVCRVVVVVVLCSQSNSSSPVQYVHSLDYFTFF